MTIAHVLLKGRVLMGTIDACVLAVVRHRAAVDAVAMGIADRATVRFGLATDARGQQRYDE